MAAADCSTGFMALEETQDLRDGTSAVGAAVAPGNKRERCRDCWSSQNTGPVTGVVATASGFCQDQALETAPRLLERLGAEQQRGRVSRLLEQPRHQAFRRTAASRFLSQEELMKELLEPAFQPVIDLVNGEVAYYEALARIRGDATDSGHVTLIELAEQCQFIHLLDLTILGQAIDAGVPEGQRIAVNFSAVTIEQHFHEVVAHLARLGAGCQDLVVEITETAPIRDPRKVAVFIEAARELGCQVALDDFGNGAGHFTPALVQFLRPDFLKLDGSILADAARTGDHGELHDALALARSVNAEVIAEYVDSEEKIELLARIGVRYGQGWVLGRPTRGIFSPVNAVNELVAETAGS